MDKADNGELVMQVPRAVIAVAAIVAMAGAFAAGKHVGATDVQDLVLLDWQAQGLAQALLAEANERWTSEGVSDLVADQTELANVSVQRASASRVALAICPEDGADADVLGVRGWQQVNLHLGLANATVIRVSCTETSIDARLLRFLGGRTLAAVNVR